MAEEEEEIKDPEGWSRHDLDEQISVNSHVYFRGENVLVRDKDWDAWQKEVEIRKTRDQRPDDEREPVARSLVDDLNETEGEEGESGDE
jgi:hypothetical protein